MEQRPHEWFPRRREKDGFFSDLGKIATKGFVLNPRPYAWRDEEVGTRGKSYVSEASEGYGAGTLHLQLTNIPSNPKALLTLVTFVLTEALILMQILLNMK